MGDTLTSALIVAKPGPMRDSLRALVTTMPQIGAVDIVNDVPSTLKGVFQRAPALILLDFDRADNEIWLTVRRAKTKWPQARSILLANDIRQQREAEAAGADAVLLKGFPAAKLAATIVSLLTREVVNECPC